MVHDYLRSQVVSHGYKSSPLKVCKGSSLGPPTFTICMNNIVSATPQCNVHLYADDNILYITGSSLNLATANLQSAFDAFHLTLIKHKLVLNTDKTKCLLFARESCLQTEIAKCYKYLWPENRLPLRPLKPIVYALLCS